MRVYFKKQIASPSVLYEQGGRYDLPDSEAMKFIEAGYAENAVIWLARLASEEGFDIKPAKKKGKIEDLLSF